MNELELYISEANAGLERSRAGATEMLNGWIETGIAVEKIKSECEVVAGGSNFSSICKERLGLSPQKASQYIKIGQNKAFILQNKTSMPEGLQTTYMLTTLSKDDFKKGIENGDINPDMTQADVTAYKHRLKFSPEKLVELLTKHAIDDPIFKDVSPDALVEVFHYLDKKEKAGEKERGTQIDKLCEVAKIKYLNPDVYAAWYREKIASWDTADPYHKTSVITTD